MSPEDVQLLQWLPDWMKMIFALTVFFGGKKYGGPVMHRAYSRVTGNGNGNGKAYSTKNAIENYVVPELQNMSKSIDVLTAELRQGRLEMSSEMSKTRQAIHARSEAILHEVGEAMTGIAVLKDRRDRQ